jgi:hypothetical protein
MIREELARLFVWEERHRRLVARIVVAFGASIVVFVIGTLLVWVFESGHSGGDIHGLGDAAFFVAVQLLTVSSSAKNPVTSPGKLLDVLLELWAIFVITAVAGSFASFFTSGDRP